MAVITEPARDIPVVDECDVCVLGGSCTGLFAAVRAARRGCRVVLIEKLNCLGGVATAGMVNIWHSIDDTEHREQIIAGLTLETVERLELRQACRRRPTDANAGFILNTEELKIELDELAREHRITVHLHTHVAAPVLVDGRITHVLIENKNGRQAIAAQVFIDATGDGDLAAWCGVPFSIDPELQPPSTCAKILGLDGLDIRTFYNTHREEFGLAEDSGWSCPVPGAPGVRMHADTHVFGADVADAVALTAAEMEGRRQIRALMDMVRKYEPERARGMCLLGLASSIGARESRRFQATYQLSEMDVLEGVHFDDAIANGSYRVDVHYPAGGGFCFKYLDGTQISYTARGGEKGRWREERAVDPTFYQIPYRTMVHPDAPNLIMAGRMIAADRPAFGAIRVMVNTNQTGEAAGEAAALVCDTACATNAVDPARVRAALAAGGSIMR